ncbi:MAG: response regulator [Bacteroidales bacterium]|nr:response regulator [Bacteroidales bacterium]
MYKILLLEDNMSDADLIGREIMKRWPDALLKTVSRLEEAKALILNDNPFDIAIFDLKLPDGNGMDLLSDLRADHIGLPIIILTGVGSEEIATAALKAGANDYIPKKSGFYKIVPEQIEYSVNQARLSSQDMAVLYVEHHQSDVDLTSMYLKKQAPYIHLTKVSTGDEALKLLKAETVLSKKFDVVLLDYRLPGLNALELSKIIRQELKLNLAIVIVTGQGDENTAVEALKIGVDDYVVKHKNYLLRLPSVLTSAYRRKELERQQIELKKSETKYRLLADYAADWEYWMNPQGEYIYISPACLQTSGYPPDAYEKNKNLLTDITLPEYKVLLEKHFLGEVFALHKPIEFQIRTAQGEIKWISHFCRPVYNDDGMYVGKRGVNRDITLQKQAEIELRQSEERFKRLFEDLGDAVFVTRVGEKNMGDILEVNTAAVQQSGYSREELLQMNIIHDLSVPNSGTEISSEDSDQKLLKGKTVTYVEKKRRKSGEEYWTEIIITPIEYKGEKAGLSINRDITDRKRAEQIQQIILNISNATQVAVNLNETMQIIQKELGYLMDTKNFFVALYNKETDRIKLPYFRDEKDDIDDFPAGKTLTALVIKSGQSLLIKSEEAQKLEATGEIERVGIDSEVWLGVPLKIKGEVTGAFVIQSYTNQNAYTEKDKEVLEIISHQISISIERKQKEEELKIALEAAKESDRMKTAFLANMSHEFRTPLNAVIGFSSLIDIDTDTTDAVNFAKLINRSGKNLLDIVDEIFEVTLIERGEVKLLRTRNTVSSILNDVYQIILHRQKNQGESAIRIEQIVSGITGQTEIFTDFDKLKQVLLSLLNNALKFTHDGHIRFGVKLDASNSNFVFFVEDSGIGIAPEKQIAVFDKFQIGDDTRTRIYSGVGVGLYITKKLVNLMGGDIWLESSEGEGSTFSFSIPK